MSAPVRPSAGPARAYAFPQADRHVLANGLTVIVAPLRRLPVVTTLCIVDAGGETDLPSQAGLGALTAQALTEGTLLRSADALAEGCERLGGELFSGAGWTRAECGITVLNARFEGALRLMAEVLRQPAFGERDVRRLRDERLAELLQLEAEPRGLADDRFARYAFGPGRRYAEPVGGSAATVTPLGAADVRAHHATHYGPSGTTLIVAGDIETQTVVRLAEDEFGSWTTARSSETRALGVPLVGERVVRVVHRADAPQSELRIGHPSVPRTHPDFYAISVMNALLGGLFNSRINLNLRERHAYTYGAFSSFDWRRQSSLFEVSTAVRSDVTAAAVTEILHEIDAMREHEVSENELSLALDYLTGVFPIRFETTAAIADAIASRESFGLAPSYYDEYRSRISAVTAAEVRRVAEAFLDPQRLQILAVGDPQVIRGPLDALKLGPIEDVPADDVPLVTEPTT